MSVFKLEHAECALDNLIIIVGGIIECDYIFSATEASEEYLNEVNSLAHLVYATVSKRFSEDEVDYSSTVIITTAYCLSLAQIFEAMETHDFVSSAVPYKPDPTDPLNLNLNKLIVCGILYQPVANTIQLNADIINKRLATITDNQGGEIYIPDEETMKGLLEKI